MLNNDPGTGKALVLAINSKYLTVTEQDEKAGQKEKRVR